MRAERPETRECICIVYVVWLVDDAVACSHGPMVCQTVSRSASVLSGVLLLDLGGV